MCGIGGDGVVYCAPNALWDVYIYIYDRYTFRYTLGPLDYSHSTIARGALATCPTSHTALGTCPTTWTSPERYGSTQRNNQKLLCLKTCNCKRLKTSKSKSNTNMCCHCGLRFVLETLRIFGKIRIDTRAYNLEDRFALCIRIPYSVSI